MAGFLIPLDALDGRDDAAHETVPGIVGELGALPVSFGPRTAAPSYGTPATVSGYLVRDWQPDYFDRIIIEIDDPNFGTVASVVERTLVVWNNYRASKSVSAQGASGAEGIAIAGFPALPFDLGPTEERSWQLQATPEGPAIISGWLTFTIGGDAYRTVDLSGLRALLFPHEPNWATSPELAREYPDIVDDAISLAEDRHAFGDRALFQLRFRLLSLSRREASSLARLLERLRALPVGVPLWPEQAELTATAAAGATVLAVSDVSARKFSLERPNVLLWAAWDAWELVEISALTATQLTLVTPLAAEWLAGTRVVPVCFGHLALSDPHDLLTDYLRERTVQFEEVPL